MRLGESRSNIAEYLLSPTALSAFSTSIFFGCPETRRLGRRFCLGTRDLLFAGAPAVENVSLALCV